MQTGKLTLEQLTELLAKIDIKDPRVVLGPRPGEDAALIDFGDKYLVTTMDPITFATDLIGWYLVQINANDLAVMGATPRWLMATLLIPEDMALQSLRRIFDQLLEACAALDIALVGGHTEITHGLSRPIAIGAMQGEVAKERVVLTSGAKPGDRIVLTQGIAIEGTAILAREASEAPVQAGVREELIESAKSFLNSPGISVVEAARIACDTDCVHAMHDPTEGGLATGLLEMATGANVGLLVEGQRIPILPECHSFCRALGLDPLGLIASGALLMAVEPQHTATLIEALSQQNIAASEIGQVTPPEEGLKLRTVDGVRDLPVFDRDELARFLDG